MPSLSSFAVHDRLVCAFLFFLRCHCDRTPSKIKVWCIFFVAESYGFGYISKTRREKYVRKDELENYKTNSDSGNHVLPVFLLLYFLAVVLKTGGIYASLLQSTNRWERILVRFEERKLEERKIAPNCCCSSIFRFGLWAQKDETVVHCPFFQQASACKDMRKYNKTRQLIHLGGCCIIF